MNRHALARLVTILLSFFLFGLPVQASSKKPTILKPCKQCHEEEANYLRGQLKSASRKAKTFQVFMGSATWQLTFDDNTEINGAPAVHKISKNHEIGVEFEQRGNLLVAKSIDVKQAADIPLNWVIDVAEMETLVAMGPQKGNYSLYDARPGKLYLEGHIEGAISNYDAMFDKNVNKLPKDKDKLLVFYCGGPT